MGHIAYLVVRMGPVFRLGSIYVPEGLEKEEWKGGMTDVQRLSELLRGRYPWLLLELGLMAAMVLTLAALRVAVESGLA